MKVVKEMLEERQLQLNRQVWSLMVRYHVVGRNADGILAAIDAMEAEGHLPSLELLEAAIARLEREGHAEGVRKLTTRAGTNNWQTSAARNKVPCKAQPSLLDHALRIGLLHQGRCHIPSHPRKSF